MKLRKSMGLIKVGWAIFSIFARYSHVTFSEKRTKMTSQLHFSKFEIPSFCNKIHKNKIIHRYFSSEKCVTSHKRQKVTVFMDSIEENQDFKF